MYSYVNGCVDAHGYGYVYVDMRLLMCICLLTDMYMHKCMHVPGSTAPGGSGSFKIGNLQEEFVAGMKEVKGESTAGLTSGWIFKLSMCVCLCSSADLLKFHCCCRCCSCSCSCSCS